MIRLNDPNIDLKDLHVAGEGGTPTWEGKRPFISYFKVKEGREQFENQNYKVTKMSKELYELLQKEL